LAYSTNFSASKVRFSDFPEFLSDVQGVFRVRPNPFTDNVDSGDVKQAPQSQVLQQLLTEERGVWFAGGFGQQPLSLVGSKHVGNYNVTVVARADLKGASATNATLAVYGRTAQGYAFGPAGGYVLTLWPASGQWSLVTGPSHDHPLANGTLEGAVDGWVTLHLELDGTTIAASVNGLRVASVVDGRYMNGFAGLGCGWHTAWFSSFGVVPLPTPPGKPS
jgi:hypothetical protein